MPKTKNWHGMVFMDPGYDGKALIGRLKQAFGCDIIGTRIGSTDIVNASREAMERLLQKINTDEDTGYAYNTIIAISCAARHMVLAVDREREAALAHELFPASLTVGGVYSFGKFCPVAAADGKADNRMPSLTLGLCAL